MAKLNLGQGRGRETGGREQTGGSVTRCPVRSPSEELTAPGALGGTAVSQSWVPVPWGEEDAQSAWEQG